MVRRVGFGGGGRAERHDAFARERDARAKARDGDNGPNCATGAARRVTGVARVFISLFLTMWLAGWTFGMIFAFTQLLNAGATAGGAFLAFWLTFAAIGWYFAARMLLRVLTGRPIRTGRKGRSAPGTQDANRNVGGEDQR